MRLFKVLIVSICLLLITSCVGNKDSWIVNDNVDLVTDNAVSGSIDVNDNVEESTLSKIGSYLDKINNIGVDDYLYDPVVSPDGKSIAYYKDKWEGYVIVKDWVESEEYYDILTDSLLYSPDSKRFIFVAEDENANQFIVESWKKGEAFYYVDESSLVFSDDSTSLSYVVENEDVEYFVIKDWVKSERYASIDSLSYTPWTTDLNYVYENYDWISTLVKDWVKQENEYETLYFPTYSSDWKNFFYIWKKEEIEYLIKNDEIIFKTEESEEIDMLTVSKTWDSYYAALITNDWDFILNDWNKWDESYSSITMLKVSPDFKTLAFVGTNDEDMDAIIVNWKKSNYFDWVVDIVFSPNSKHIAYEVEDWTDKYFVYKDDKRITTQAEYPYFSPDSKKFLYIKWWLDNNNKLVIEDL